jgi:hypothetical protein
MNRRGIEFTLMQIRPDLWQWQFQIGETITRGKTNTTLKGLAARRVHAKIDRALKGPRGPKSILPE